MSNAPTLQSYLHPNLSTLASNDVNPVEREIRSSDIPVFVCYGIISLLGCFCNSITIVVMARNTSLHTLYNYFLLNLAVVDLMASLFSIAKAIIIFTVHNSGGISDLSSTLLCRFFTAMIYFGIIMSVTTLVAISLERYFGIVKPLIHRNMTRKRIIYFLVISWCTSMITAAIISQELDMDKKSYYCFLSADENDWPRFKWILGYICLTFAYVIPLIVITVLYIRVIVFMKRRSREPNIALGGNAQAAQLAAKKTAKMVRLLLVITVLFGVAILPELVYFAMILYDRKYVDASLFYKIGIPTVAIIAVNPFVYTLSNSTFRVAAQRLFRSSRQSRVAPAVMTTKTTAQTACASRSTS